MAEEQITHLYCDIVKGADEATICGFVTSGRTDIGGHIIDPAWIKKALPPWIQRWGNTRAQHDPRQPIGVVDPTSLEFQGDKPYVEIRVVDSEALKKVHAGVYKGISMGIKNPVFAADPAAPNGRIIGGDILEISLVDRPANPDAVITLIKSAGPGEWKDLQTGAVLTDKPSAGMAAAERNPSPGSPLAEREALLARAAQVGEQAAIADVVKAAAPNHSFGTEAQSQQPAGWQPRNLEELHQMEAASAAVAAATKPDAVADADLQAGDVAKVQAGNSSRSHESHAHPYSGTHNHAHGHEHPYTGKSVVHSHAHGHSDDDIHGPTHDGSSHAGSDVMKAAFVAAPALADQLVAHLVEMPGVAAVVKSDVLKVVSDAVADVVKAAKDFDVQYPAAATTARPGRLEETTTNGLNIGQEPRDAASRLEALANQTDQDRDGDIDGMAQQAETGGAKSAPADSAPQGASAGSLISPVPLELTFAAHKAEIIKLVVADPGFTAYVASLVKAATAAAVAEVAPDTHQLVAVPQIAKMAGTLATGLQALATVTGELSSGLDGVRADVSKAASQVDLLKRDLEAVKAVAVQEKGVGLGTAVAAVDKGFLLDPVTFKAASAAGDAGILERMIGANPGDFAAALLNSSEGDRMKLAASMLGGSSRR